MRAIGFVPNKSKHATGYPTLTGAKSLFILPAFNGLKNFCLPEKSYEERARYPKYSSVSHGSHPGHILPGNLKNFNFFVQNGRYPHNPDRWWYTSNDETNRWWTTSANQLAPSIHKESGLEEYRIDFDPRTMSQKFVDPNNEMWFTRRAFDEPSKNRLARFLRLGNGQGGGWFRRDGESYEQWSTRANNDNQASEKHQQANTLPLYDSAAKRLVARFDMACKHYLIHTPVESVRFLFRQAFPGFSNMVTDPFAGLQSLLTIATFYNYLSNQLTIQGLLASVVSSLGVRLVVAQIVIPMVHYGWRAESRKVRVAGALLST